MYSLSIHNGKTVNISHNNRDKESIYNQTHIQKDGDFEILKQQDIKEAYNSIFGEAIQSYNEKQNRSDRKIKSYYDKIQSGADKKNNPKLCYELIVAVGNMEQSLDEELNKKILKEYFEQWEERNPNLKVFNAVYHNDEVGVPHLHIDYIPIAHYQKGLEIRNSLNKALNEMGFQNDTFSNTPIMRWEKSEQDALKEICTSYGVETINKKAEHREHLTTENYKLQKENENLIKANNGLKNIHNQELKDFDKKLREAQKQGEWLTNRGGNLSDFMENNLNEIIYKLKQQTENSYAIHTIDSEERKEILNRIDEVLNIAPDYKEVIEKTKTFTKELKEEFELI